MRKPGRQARVAGCNRCRRHLGRPEHARVGCGRRLVPRQSARYQRYFTSTPSAVVRMGLESELSRVRGWVASPGSEPEQSLKDLGTRLAAIIKQGEAALEQRRQAVAARSDHGVRTIIPLIEDINAARGSLYGNLAEQGRKARLPIDWPSRFFRRSSRTPRVEEVAPALGATPAAPAPSP